MTQSGRPWHRAMIQAPGHDLHQDRFRPPRYCLLTKAGKALGKWQAPDTGYCTFGTRICRLSHMVQGGANMQTQYFISTKQQGRTWFALMDGEANRFPARVAPR